MEGFANDRFGDRARLRAVATEDDHAGVVIFHRQASVILGPSYFADVLAALQPARWHAHRTREASNVDAWFRGEMTAGWVTVLMAHDSGWTNVMLVG